MKGKFYWPDWINAVFVALSALGTFGSWYFSDATSFVVLKRDIDNQVSSLRSDISQAQKKQDQLVLDLRSEFTRYNNFSKEGVSRTVSVPIYGVSDNAECATGEYIAGFQVRATGLDVPGAVARVTHKCVSLPKLNPIGR
jgi:hypothetical protein